MCTALRVMGAQTSRTDFEWVYTQQPHVTRRKLILRKFRVHVEYVFSMLIGRACLTESCVVCVLEKYPEIKKLMGPDPHFKYIVTAMVVFQVVSCYYICQLSYPWIILISYFLGGVINHSLTLAIHDISHNVVFGNYYPLSNRLFGMFANLPIGVPISIAFKKYHIEHHRYLGVDFYDVDLSTDWEGRFFCSTPRKLLWLFLQPLFYAIRPSIVRPKPPTKLEILNYAVQFVFDACIYYFIGVKGLVYFIAGTILCMGLHPMTAHFIAEHYMFDRGYETYSYYGPWNYLTFNVGYHMEHHDFPYIPGSRLPEVKRIAAEFYDNLPQHKSWFSVLWRFLFHHDIGPYCRTKRHYEDIFGSHRDQNPYLEANNSMKPVLVGDPIITVSSANGLTKRSATDEGKGANGHVRSVEPPVCGHRKDL